jgi:hypothetical protein
MQSVAIGNAELAFRSPDSRTENETRWAPQMDSL